MTRADRPGSNQFGALAPLALGVALASHAAADAKVSDPHKMRMVGPDPIATATAEEARAHGKLMLASNNVAEALQAYRQALAQDPDSIESLNGIAVCYDRLGRYEDSRLHYEAALGIDPTSPMLLNNYGLSLFLQGELAEAARFLRLAAAAGDEQVQAASLRTLARIERKQAERQPSAAPSRPVQVAAAETGPRVVRTSGHELRLVLDQPARPAAVQLAVADRPVEDAAAIAAVGDFTPAEEAHIAHAEAMAIAAEYAAAARAEAQARVEAMADQLPPVPAEMLVDAWLDSARRKGPLDEPAAPLMPVAPQAIGSPPAAPDWHRDQILVMAPNSQRPDRESFDRTSLRMALLAAGFAPPRPSQRALLAAAARAALEPDAPRRSFAQPFESDNGRLNGLAQRLHGEAAGSEVPDVAEQIARLEDLIARIRAA